MNIITVIPLTRSKAVSSLTYFTSSEVPVGAVVSVPLRAATVHAIVTESRPAEDLKAEIRKAPYEIRKLGRVKAGAFFSSAFMEACRSLADWYASTPGAVVAALVPEAILESAHRIAPPLPVQPSFLSRAPAPDETYAVQGDDADRISSWRSVIRQEFARKRSLAVYVPTIEDARSLFASLEKGIEGYIILLHASLPKKKLLEAWAAVSETEHPVVVVATPSFTVLPRGDIETIVIERENARGWISQRAPYLDHRRAIETIARREHRSVYLADSLLRAETLERVESHEIAEGTPFKWRSISTATDSLIDMKREAAKPGSAKAAFRVLSPELESLIRRNLEENTHLVLLVGRRGTSPVTVCQDCEAIVSCAQCSAPVVLHTAKTGGKRFYMCHVCGVRRPAEDECANCGGSRLTPLGIGAERVEQDIKALFPGVETVRVDADSTTTEKQVSGAIERWRSRPGSVLVGTETALLHLSGSTDHAAAVSLDSLFALPDFRVEERLMYLLIRLRSAATRSVLVQTRRIGEKVFEYALKGNLSDFYHSVSAGRKRFGYPPFSILVKITLEGKKETIAKQMGELQAYLLPHEIDVFPAFTSTVRGASVIHGLIKVQPKQWPDMDLVDKLRGLPQSVGVKINPESLL